MTVHESQSLSLEMMAGRSRGVPGLPRAADGRTSRRRRGASGRCANVLNIWRRLDDGFIRVEADEITYPLHVILRYRLEQALLVRRPGGRRHSRRLGRAVRQAARPHAAGPGARLPAGHPLGRRPVRLFPQLRHGLDAGGAALRARRRPTIREILPGAGPRRLHPLLRLGAARACTQRASLIDFATLVADATGAALSTAAFKRHVTRRYLEEPAP